VPVTWKKLQEAVEVTEVENRMRRKAADALLAILMKDGRDGRHGLEIREAEDAGQGAEWGRRFAAALASRFDHRGMRHAAAVWARWSRWREEQPRRPGGKAEAPMPLDLAVFLDDVAEKGPTAAWGVLVGLKWLLTHLGFEGLPLGSPLLVGHTAPGTRQVPKHAAELPIELWCHLRWLASQELGAVSLMAKIVIFLVASSLRLRHAQRLLWIEASCGARTLVAEVTRGKVRRGAPFRIGVPTHVAPDEPVLRELYDELMVSVGNPGYLIPDIELHRQRGLCPEAKVVAKPMSYGKFMGCFRALLMAEPMELSFADAKEYASYSLRRKMPTVADRLRLSMEMRDELGNWREAIDQQGSKQRKASEPMAVRYSEAKLESAAQTRRLCLLAMSRVADTKAEDGETRRMATETNVMLQKVLGADWGIGLGDSDDDSSSAKTSEGGAVSEAGSGHGQDSPATSGSSSLSGDETSDKGSAVSVSELEWILPKGPTSRLHLCRLEVDEQGARLPWCRGSAFKWGFQTGVGVMDAEGTGREWSPRCRAELERRQG